MRHVLVVDDEQAICELMQMALEADGSCRVTSASNPYYVAAILERDKPDVAIIDAVLRKASGLRLARLAVDLGIPVLIVTGAPETGKKLDRAGCPFLWKPFHIGTLCAETRVLIDDAAHRCAQLAILLRYLDT